MLFDIDMCWPMAHGSSLCTWRSSKCNHHVSKEIIESLATKSCPPFALLQIYIPTLHPFRRLFWITCAPAASRRLYSSASWASKVGRSLGKSQKWQSEKNQPCVQYCSRQVHLHSVGQDMCFQIDCYGGGPTSLASCWWLSNVVSTNANDGRIAPSISILAAKNIGSTTSSYLPIYPISMQYPITTCQLPINFPPSNMFSAPVSISPTTSRESPTLKGGDRNISGELDGLQHHLIPKIIKYC